MVTSIIKKISVFVVLLSLLGCPSLDPCVTSGYSTIISDAIIITPLQNTYQVGDEIIVSMALSSEQTFLDGTIIDIYQKTNIESEQLESTEIYKIIEGNSFNILEGNYENYKPILYYYVSENEYRFKIKVILTKVGNYSLYANGDLSFKDPNDDCNTYSIEANIEGMDENRKIEFTVE